MISSSRIEWPGKMANPNIKQLGPTFAIVVILKVLRLRYMT